MTSNVPQTPEEQKDLVRRGYDRLSYAYRSDDCLDDYGDYAEWVRIISERVSPGEAVLDIGCGCGLPATRMLARRFEVTGVDISAEQIRRARLLVPEAHFIRADIVDPEAQHIFHPDQFSAVVSFYSIIHMPLSQHRHLYELIARWLKPGGSLLAIVGHEAWTGIEERYLDVDDGLMFWSHPDESTTLSWLSDAGLTVCWTRFVPEGESGHTLVLAERPGRGSLTGGK